MILKNKKSYKLCLVLALLMTFICTGCAGPDTADTGTSSPATTNTITSPTTPPETTTETPTSTDTTTPATATEPATTPVAREGKPFIWEISSDSTHVYLLGSVHAARASLYPLAAVIEDAFDEAEYLVVEVNVNDIDETKILELVLEYGTYPAGEGLKDNLPEDLYEKLDEHLAGWSIPLSLLDPYRPWFIVNLIEVTSFENLDYSAEYGIDSHFIDAAIANGLEILELETEEFQIELIANVPDDVMILSIEQYLDDPVTGQDIEELFEIWVTGDAPAMEEFTFEGLIEEPELRPYYEGLLIDRNYNMQEKIEGFLEDDEVYFIVVGAGHLVGDEGLLNLLEKAGYAVEQLEYRAN
ncbi:MAG: TraB/GumN family protein [Dehalococcoidia bacterium]